MAGNYLLLKDVTIKKIDNTFIRGICVEYNSDGIIVEIKEKNRLVFVPFYQISEVFTSDM